MLFLATSGEKTRFPVDCPGDRWALQETFKRVVQRLHSEWVFNPKGGGLKKALWKRYP